MWVSRESLIDLTWHTNPFLSICSNGKRGESEGETNKGTFLIVVSCVNVLAGRVFVFGWLMLKWCGECL